MLTRPWSQVRTSVVSFLLSLTALTMAWTPPPAWAGDDLPQPMPLGAPRLAEPAIRPVKPPAVEGELDVESLVQQVLARNRSLAQMVAASQAAAARYPQVTSLEDPMFGTTIAPGSIGSRDVEFGYRLEISQKYPFPGKLALRGQNALAEASAAGHDVEDMRLQLAESARSAFYDYYLVGRALEVNEDSLGLLRDFRGNAETRYKTGLVPQQDVLQADVELGRQGERQLTLERMRQVAVARINTLQHLPPDAPLPPPPARLRRPEALPEASMLQATALARRPDLQALADRIRAEQASLALAQKEFRPDFETTAAYDTIMGNGPMRDLAPQVGVRLNLPFRKAKRYAALAEIQARIAGRQAELDRLTDQVSFQVQEAYEQARESERVVDLFDTTILPAAEANVKAAQSAYVTAKVPFLSLIEAQRNFVLLRDRRYEVIADYFRRRATLERVVGGPLVPMPEGAHSGN
jgi:cobalt-zinc-cadmium efflux system outer membrane protein